VLARARDAGLVEPGKQELTDDELMRLISRPGFSTAERVTDISGRGVGVDAVMARVRAMGGAVEMRSAPGEGTSVTVRLPLTLAIVRALLARAGDETYALPLTHVSETVDVTPSMLRTVRGRDVLVWRDAVLPLVRLRDVVHHPDGRARAASARRWSWRSARGTPRSSSTSSWGSRRSWSSSSTGCGRERVRGRVLRRHDPGRRNARPDRRRVQSSLSGASMDDLRTLQPIQVDALREVANIGAGHAATALSQMTGATIMISVPRINVARLEDVSPQITSPEEPVAAVLMHMLGDLTGRTLLVFPRPTAIRLAELMLRRPQGSSRRSASWSSRRSRRPATSSAAPT
jgi:CheY-specific phosphatase CheX